jgi:hypothetical protein
MDSKLVMDKQPASGSQINQLIQYLYSKVQVQQKEQPKK